MIFKGAKIVLRRSFSPFWREKRCLHLQEYQSKDLMASFGINTQKFAIARSSKEAIKAVELIKSDEYVVKAQILAGGRGKGVLSSGLKGGVHVTRDAANIPRLTTQMVGHYLKTAQTGELGVLVREVMIAEAKDPVKEAYFAILLDRNEGGIVLVGSPAGGMNIEEVAHSTPHLIFKEVIISETGPSEEQLRRLAQNMGFNISEEIMTSAIEQMQRLFKLFTSCDALQVEINPFGLTSEGKVLCFDAKIVFDDNAAFRRPASLRSVEACSEQEGDSCDVREQIAQKHGLNYIGMEGSIGCLVNGAGLAMATMDVLNLYGGKPANFLDVGGGAQSDQIAAAFTLLLSDPQVKTILVNIFGGIVRCDVIAEGIIKSVAQRGPEQGRIVPLVLRLNGTNREAAIEMLKSKYPLPVQFVEDLDEAASIAVQFSTDQAKEINSSS